MTEKTFIDFVTKKVKENLPKGYENLFPFIMGIIETESSFNPYACRYEPHYRWIYKPEEFYISYSSTVETEIQFQKCSLGLMQLMGAVYRELGYKKPLSAVFEDIDAQISYGIRHFLKFYKKYGTVQAAIAAYNAGSPRKASHGGYVNQGYVDKVVRNSEKWRK